MTKKIIVHIESPIWSKVEGREGRKLLSPFLSYKKEFWQESQYSKKQCFYNASMVNSSGHFLSGFKNRVIELSQRNGFSISWVENIKQEVFSFCDPHLSHIVFRPDQHQVISSVMKNPRGVVKGPTGIGKTILGLGIISCFPGKNSLFLVNEKTILSQTYHEARKAGLVVSRYGGGYKEPKAREGVTVGMIQSIVRLDLRELSAYYDIVVVDECDIGMGKGSLLYKILTNLLAPVRIGLSATLPSNIENKLFLEGLLGPVIAEMTIREGIEKDLLARPKVKLLKGCLVDDMIGNTTYHKIYDAGIVNNDRRNRRIVIECIQDSNEGKTVLVLVTKIEHGNNLAYMFKEMGIDVPFVWANTEADERDKIRLSLNRKDTKIVIANAVWKRGVNIPTLDVVFNAAGEKSEVSTIQRIGRGFRKSEGKEVLMIKDFLDEGKYISNHTVKRLNLYNTEGWLCQT